MATTEERLITSDELRELYESSPSSDQKHAARKRRAPADFDSLARVLLIAWMVVIGSILLFEPRPDNPNAAIPLWVELAGTGFLLSFFATVAGLGTVKRWGLGASLAAVGFGGVLAVACSTTGHHAGAWWAMELAAFAVLGALTVGGIRAR
jgi:hypothetical protein